MDGFQALPASASATPLRIGRQNGQMTLSAVLHRWCSCPLPGLLGQQSKWVPGQVHLSLQRAEAYRTPWAKSIHWVCSTPRSGRPQPCFACSSATKPARHVIHGLCLAARWHLREKHSGRAGPSIPVQPTTHRMRTYSLQSVNTTSNQFAVGLQLPGWLTTSPGTRNTHPVLPPFSW